MPERVTALREKLATLKIDGFLVTSHAHLRYLTGFSGSNGLALVTASDIAVVTDRRYKDQVFNEINGATGYICETDLYHPLQDHKLLRGCKRLGFEAAHLPFRDFSRLRRLADGAELVATENLLERITAAKLPAEIARIERACEIAAETWKKALAWLKPGMSELDFAAEIIYQSRKSGSEGEAFEPIVASGWRSALPHGVASKKKMARGELVVIDFGCTCEGFCSDVTRTVMLGEPTPQQRQMYEAVREANDLAIRKVWAGQPAAELDSVARNFLAAQGYTTAFSHSLGHGLGLDVHSLPRIGQRSQDVIPENAVITIEPGLYIPEIGGARIEDDVRVTGTHAQVLTDIDRDLLVIE